MKDVLGDALLSFRLLKVGGIMMFDDYNMIGVARATAAFEEALGDLVKVLYSDEVRVERCDIYLVGSCRHGVFHAYCALFPVCSGQLPKIDVLVPGTDRPRRQLRYSNYSLDVNCDTVTITT